MGIPHSSTSGFGLAVAVADLRAPTVTRGSGGVRAVQLPQPFTLFNAGLYDFSSLRKLPWADWRFFALKLFGCKDEPHTIGGLRLDGKFKGASVLVFNHHEQPGKHIDEDTIADIHRAVAKKIGRKFFIIAPRGVFSFQQDYIDIEGIRYYALRIPYSIINELHSRQFTALAQPSDEQAINETVDAVGFDFIRPPKVEWTVGNRTPKGQMFPVAFLKIKSFESSARVRGSDVRGDLDTLSMVLFDLSYESDIFNVDLTFFGDQLAGREWEAQLPAHEIGDAAMVVFLDAFGNEAREVIPRSAFGLAPRAASGAAKGGAKRSPKKKMKTVVKTIVKTVAKRKAKLAPTKATKKKHTVRHAKKR
jgi:hypothetical protein